MPASGLTSLRTQYIRIRCGRRLSRITDRAKFCVVEVRKGERGEGVVSQYTLAGGMSSHACIPSER
jgi:hypothetical protein